MNWFNLLFNLFLFWFAACYAAPIELKKVELSQVSHQIQHLQKTIIMNKQQETSLQQQLMLAETWIGDLDSQMRELNKILVKQQQALIQLKQLENKFSHQLQNQQTALKMQLLSAYKLGDNQQWKILINQENINLTNRHLIYYRYLSQARLQLLASIKQTLSSLNTTIQTTRQSEQNIQTILQQKLQQQLEQQTLIRTRQQLVQKLNEQTKNKQQELDGLLANQKALQEIVSQLNIKILRPPKLSFSQLQKKLHWPVKGNIIAQFGHPLDIGNQNSTGVIIKTAAGAPVRAIYSGKVIFASWLRGLGLLIIINHGDNYMSLYARNQALYAKVGDQVNLGDVIAAAGNTGGYDKTSLYFEIRKNGVPVNPQFWCR